MATKIVGAAIQEQGVSFAVVVAKEHVMSNRPLAEEMIAACSPVFGGIPVVLAAKDALGKFSYVGRRDLVNFLAGIDPARIPWADYTVTGGGW